MDRVRLGVIGTGHVSPLGVAGYLEHERCDVVAVCDADLGRAHAFAERHRIPKVHPGLEALLADDEIDAVEVLTPTDLHKEHVLAAVAAGKHVSCQKPIANSVADGIEMAEAALDAGVVFRIGECFFHYPPLVKAKELIASGAIGVPTMLRMKTVVGWVDSEFQLAEEMWSLEWRFGGRSPGGHLFDDMIHKYAVASWLFDQDVTSVQAIVRRAPMFFEAPTAAIWEYERETLLGMMEVTYAPRMRVRSRYYGADEFFEVQGTEGFLWVTRATGEMLDLSPVVLREADGSETHFSNLDADWLSGFKGSSRHFVDALLEGRTDPDMSPEAAVKALQLCFAVYKASTDRRPVAPASITDAVSPPWWPPDLSAGAVDFERYLSG